MKTSFFSAMIFIISVWCYAQTTSAPVRAPAYFGGIDTLSKFSKKPSEGFKPSEGYKIDVSRFPPGVYYVKVGIRVCRFIKI